MTNPIKPHIVAFDRAGTDALLHCFDGEKTWLLSEFLAQSPPPQPGMERMIPVSFGPDFHSAVSLDDVLGAVSFATLNGPNSRAANYIPMISVGLMDREGNLFAGHVDSLIAASSIPWAEITTGRYKTDLSHLIAHRAQRVLEELFDIRDPMNPAPAFSRSNLRAVNLLGCYVFVRDIAAIESIIMIRIYMIVDKLVPCVMKNTLEAATDSDAYLEYIAANTIRPVTTAEYVARWETPKPNPLSSFSAQASVLVSGQATKEWLELNLNHALNDEALAKKQTQAVQDQPTPTEISSS